MMTRNLRKLAFAAAAGLLIALPSRADDWPMFGRTPQRNMYTPEKNPPTDWDVADKKNIKWAAELGSLSYGNPVVANGVVYIGTNNEAKRDPAFVKDAGVLMAFRESDGKFLWQRISPKLGSGRVNDWPYEGVCSTVYAEGSRIWYCTNRCEAVCLDYSPGGGPQPKVLWSVDMMAALGVFPHNMTDCSITAWGDYIYVTTANGVDDTHKYVVAPQAPGIVCFEKNTGKVIWTDNSPGENVLHGQWSSPAIAEINGQALCLAALGDAWLYGFDAKTGKHVFTFDLNPKASVYPQGGRNEVIASPVIWDNKLYIGTGQDPEHGEGDKADLWCIDLVKAVKTGGDVSEELDANPAQGKPQPGQQLMVPAGAGQRKGKPNPNSAAVWHFHATDANHNGKIEPAERMHRTISTVAIDPSTGILFAPDFSGFLHCMDARTGEIFWNKDLEGAVWGSPMISDGKVYIGDENGFVRIFEVSKKLKMLSEHDMGGKVYCSPVFANGTLYIMTVDKLYAIEEKK